MAKARMGIEDGTIEDLLRTKLLRIHLRMKIKKQASF
jgi:hypothetical protein